MTIMDVLFFVVRVFALVVIIRVICSNNIKALDGERQRAVILLSWAGIFTLSIQFVYDFFRLLNNLLN
ncbi:hypothetical protein STSP2_00197 [Anaerohalosphaera lusitana]|uniref:Uncharacterized protein n=1 Tax=Anaerohalosphaera lusitana TaxID=1936003 RepID=A0A1U9NH12_9BACT|nr:hypothetical protein STSP2_00197 [Anaerohalosphaera lusitana]